MKRFTIIAVGLASARYPKANPSAWLALRMAPLLTLWGTACLGLWLGAGGMSAVNAWAAPALRPVLLQISERVFSRPHDLVLSPDGKFLYVADVGNNVVQVLDPASLKILGKIGGGDLIRPHDVAFDKRGRLLVADTGNDRIAVYQVNGAGAKWLGEIKGGMDSPEGVAPLPDGRVAVTNAGAHNVIVFFRGKVVRTFGGGGREPGAYLRPHDVQADAQGRLFITDPGNNRIHILNARLEPEGMLEAPAFRFNEPKYLAFDAQGRFYVADEYNNAIKIFDRGMRRVAQIPPISGGRAHRLNQPEGVTARDGKVWVSDTYNNLILLYELRQAP